MRSTFDDEFEESVNFFVLPPGKSLFETIHNSS